MIRFVPAPGFARDIVRSGGVRAMLEDVGSMVAHRAADLAPDDPRTRWSNRRLGVRDLPRSIDNDVVMTEDGWTGRVFAEAWYAGFVEVEQPFLRPAVEQTVGRLEKGRRG